jgi:hypothetical protein
VHRGAGADQGGNLGKLAARIAALDQVFPRFLVQHHGHADCPLVFLRNALDFVWRNEGGNNFRNAKGAAARFILRAAAPFS